MKAMQLREKKKKQSLQPALPSPPATVSEVSSIREEPVPAEVIPEETEDNESQDLPSMLQVDRLSMSKADSGIDVASSIHNDHVSVDSQLDSHPASPIGASSEIGDSTKASSLSESTDETVHVNEEKPVPQDDDEEPEADVNEKITGDDNEINEEDTPIAEVQDVEETIETHEVPAEEKVEEEVENDEPTVETEVLPVETEQKLPEPSPVLPISKFAARAQDLPEVMESIERDPEVSEPTHVSDLKQDDVKSASPVSPQFKLPKSKFSTQDMTSIASPAVPAIVTPPEEANEEAAPEHVIVAKASIDVETASIDSKRSKRRALVEPIKTNLELPERDNGLSDDDDLMDELQDAVVEEAKPIAVSKSPISPVFASSPPKQTPRIVRTVSNPIRGPLLAPGDVSTSSARSLSGGAAFLHKLTQQQSSSHLAPKTGKIGSNISQRIKALEMLSVSSGAPTEGVPKERPSSAFFSVRRGSVRDPARSPSVAERANSLTRGGLTPSPPRSRETSPEENKAPSRERSASVASRLSMFEGGNAPRGRPDSVQVTARIIRDPSQPFPKTPELRTDSTEYTPVEFRQSTLIVDLQKSAPSLAPSPAPAVLAEPPQEPRPSIQERRLSKDKKRRSQSEDRTEDKLEGNRPRRRSSLSIVKDFIKERRGSLIGKSPSTDNLNLTSPALSTPGTGRSPSRPPSVHTNTGFTGRLSISSRRSSISRDNVITPPTPGNPLSPSLMTETSGSGDEKQSDRKSISGSSTKDGKSRASRFMRRLSSSLSSGRNKLPPSISPTVTEEDAAEVEASIGVPPSRGSINPNVPSIVAYLGDVNVQFPDNLLWKRRTMCLDSQGFLILSAVQGVTATTTAAAMGREKQAGAIKRYHLSDFRQPYTPEMEVQELPNSVCLDFVDGSGLQIACEDRAGQLNVLHSKLFFAEDEREGFTDSM
ncbi:putative gpi-anchored cell surface glyco protein [Phaeoacremonium minimum UCRPA7]|uniref:Putative gpi-anchored cell surface glyco protein n=1 Tax=Phaeoacremonium minimum (strain UCR-PA7) TaxID=1286976 RepID=R8BA47_PHAM7|nr:putative gpi-anchored cell surface glyco protein [Phaeoacremonium minimum UCRPA7]EON96190.1 putative gpi-anchored cell surface glyco protein [Phaeoacremonium minimum UCRPA7]